MGLFKYISGLIFKNNAYSDDVLLRHELWDAVKKKYSKVRKHKSAIIVNDLFSIKVFIFEKSIEQDEMWLGIMFEVQYLNINDLVREKIYVKNKDDNLKKTFQDTVKEFLPLLTILLKSYSDDDFNYKLETPWGRRSLLWNCYLSPIMLKGHDSDQQINDSYYYFMLKDDISPSLGNKLFYVIKLSVSTFTDSFESYKTAVCLLDGDELADAQESLLYDPIDWAEEHVKVRTQYMVFRQSKETFSSPYSRMKLCEIVPAAVETMVQHYDNDDLYEEISLIAKGESRLALELFLLIPEVFFEKVYKEFKCDDDITLKFAGAGDEVINKNQFAVYNLIKAAVSDYLAEYGVTDELKELIGSRSSSMSVINEYINNGGIIADIGYISCVWQINEDYKPYY